MRRDKEDGVPVPVLRWQSEQQRDDRASQPWQRVRQLVLLRMAKSAMQRENICTHARGAKRPCGQPARRGESACSITHQRDARAHRRAGRARKRKKHRLGHAAGPPRGREGDDDGIYDYEAVVCSVGTSCMDSEALFV